MPKYYPTKKEFEPFIPDDFDEIIKNAVEWYPEITKIRELPLDPSMAEFDRELTNKCKMFFGWLKTWYGYRLFSFKNAKEDTRITGYSEYAVSQWLNILWKTGHIRKFVSGEFVNYRNKINEYQLGKYWGVHYKIKEK